MRLCTLPLAGLLDDYLSEADNPATEVSSNTAASTSESDQYEDLFHSLIFSGDTRTDVAKKLERCTDTKFAEYLQSAFTQSEDQDEKEGLLELMGLIAQVVEETELQEQQEIAALSSKESTTAQLQEELDQEEAKEKAAAAAAAASQSMSNADVLKQANAIDEAVMTQVMSDDEKPSDFISDCREVVNLSRGFNNQGHMRVGGR